MHGPQQPEKLLTVQSASFAQRPGLLKGDVAMGGMTPSAPSGETQLDGTTPASCTEVAAVDVAEGVGGGVAVVDGGPLGAGAVVVAGVTADGVTADGVTVAGVTAEGEPGGGVSAPQATTSARSTTLAEHRTGARRICRMLPPGHDGYALRMCLAITMRCTSLVPSPISQILASRRWRSTENSRV